MSSCEGCRGLEIEAGQRGRDYYRCKKCGWILEAVPEGRRVPPVRPAWCRGRRPQNKPLGGD